MFHLNGKNVIGGSILIIIGTSLLLQSLFGIQIPVWEVLVPLILIFIGISLIFRKPDRLT